MKQVSILIVLIIVLASFLVVGGAFYVVNEAEQVIITQFGKPVGDPVMTPGLKIKVPFLQKANFFDKRFLEWDGAPNEVPTKDKRFIYVDTYARWRIVDPLLFFQRLRDETRRPVPLRRHSRRRDPHHHRQAQPHRGGAQHQPRVRRLLGHG